MKISKRNVLLSMWCVLLASACATRPLPPAQPVMEQPDHMIDAFLAERTFNVVQRLRDLPQDVQDLIEKRQDGSIAIAESGELWNASSSWHIRSGVSNELAVVVNVQQQDYVGNRTFIRIYDRRRRAGVTCLANPSAREWDGSNHTREMFTALLTDGSSCMELGTWLVGVPPMAQQCGPGDPRYFVLVDPDATYASYDAAFVGEVVSSLPIDSSWERVTMRVREQFKRDVGEQISLAVRARDICSPSIARNTKYIVFALNRPKEERRFLDAPSVPWDGDLILGLTVEADSTYTPYSERVRSVLSRLRTLRDDEEEREMVLRRQAQSLQ